MIRENYAQALWRQTAASRHHEIIKKHESPKWRRSAQPATFQAGEEIFRCSMRSRRRCGARDALGGQTGSSGGRRTPDGGQTRQHRVPGGGGGSSTQQWQRRELRRLLRNQRDGDPRTKGDSCTYAAAATTGRPHADGRGGWSRACRRWSSGGRWQRSQSYFLQRELRGQSGDLPRLGAQKMGTRAGTRDGSSKHSRAGRDRGGSAGRGLEGGLGSRPEERGAQRVTICNPQRRRPRRSACSYRRLQRRWPRRARRRTRQRRCRRSGRAGSASFGGACGSAMGSGGAAARSEGPARPAETGRVAFGQDAGAASAHQGRRWRQQREGGDAGGREDEGCRARG